MKNNNHHFARYGIELESFPFHVQVESLSKIVEAMDGLSGKARVFDHHSRSVLFDGNVHDLCRALNDLLTPYAQET